MYFTFFFILTPINTYFFYFFLHVLSKNIVLNSLDATT